MSAPSSPSPFTVVIIEDQTAIREMLAEILRLDANYKLVGEAGDGQTAVQLCLDSQPDVCVLDVTMPELNGLEAARQIKKLLPNVEILILTVHESEQIASEVLKVGARGYEALERAFFEHDLYNLPNSERPDCHKDGTTYGSVYGRMFPDRPAPTITTGFMTPGRGRFIHPLLPRTLTPWEAARIQGFPDTYNFFPDPAKGGLPHAIEGMVKEVTVS